MAVNRWTDTLFAKLSLLLGERGNQSDHAVRFKDLTSSMLTVQNAFKVDIGKASSDLSDEIEEIGVAIPNLQDEVARAMSEAELAAQNATNAANAAAEVTNAHNALVADFTGTIAGALSGVSAQMNATDLSLGGVIAQITGMLPSTFAGGAGYWQAASTAITAGTAVTFPISYNSALQASAMTIGGTGSISLGPRETVSVDHSKVYEVEVKGIVTDNGSTGSMLHQIGLYSWTDSGTLVNANLTITLTPKMVSNGVFNETIVIAGANAVLDASVTRITLGATCKRFRPHYRMNTSGGSSATVAISMLAVREITGAAKAAYTDARLTNDYYTSAGTDAVIAAATTSLTAQINGVSSNLSSNYYTTVQTNSAITAASNILSARLDGVSESLTGQQFITDAIAKVTVGSAVTVALGGVDLQQANTITVSEGATARVTSGATNGASIYIEPSKAMLLAGQRIKIGILAKKPAASQASYFGIAYSTSGSSNSGYMKSEKALTTSWEWHIFYYDVPALVSGSNSHYIGIFGDDTKTGKGTRIARAYVGIAAATGEMPAIQTLQGNVTDILGLNLDNVTGTSFGTLLTQLQVGATGGSATITAQGSAIATMQDNASASYVLRATAGGAAAGLELVAANNPSGESSALRMHADNILLDGTVSASKLIVGNSKNLIVNSDFEQGLKCITSGSNGAAGTASTLSIRPATNAWTNGVRPVLQIYQNTDDSAGYFDAYLWDQGDISTKTFDVDAGARYEFSAYLSAHRCSAQLYIQWRDANGTYLPESGVTMTESVGSSTDPLSWQRPVVFGTAPATARYARLIIRKLGTNRGTNSYLFAFQPMFALTTANATVAQAYQSNGIVYIDGGNVVANTITTEHLNVNFLSSGRLQAGYLDVNSMLEIDSGAGLRYQKAGVSSDSTDGLYFGNDGSKFGFAASRTASGKRQSIKLASTTGLQVLNAKHYVSGNTAAVSVGTRTTSTITLPTGTTSISVDLIGGGGGADSRSEGQTGVTYKGSAGGTSTVKLYDGTTLKHTFTAAGGAGGSIAKSYSDSSIDKDTIYSDYGNGGRGAAYTLPRGDNTWYDRTNGGGAGSVTSTDVIDVSTWTSPRIQFSGGAGGAAGASSDHTGTAGTAGGMLYAYAIGKDIPADVVPLEPTATGSVTKVSNTFTFPNLGAGFWILCNPSNLNSTFNLGTIEISNNTYIYPWNTAYVSFFSSKTPVQTVVAASGSQTINYIFYSMGSWG